MQCIGKSSKYQQQDIYHCINKKLLPYVNSSRLLNVIPGMEFSQLGNGVTITGTSRKLKVRSQHGQNLPWNLFL